VSENVALRLVLPGVVVTWFVTGLPDLGKVDGSRAVPLETALRQDKLTVAGESAKAGYVQEQSHAAVFCGDPVTPGLG
jgi:hypothetical protein